MKVYFTGKKCGGERNDLSCKLLLLARFIAVHFLRLSLKGGGAAEVNLDVALTVSLRQMDCFGLFSSSSSSFNIS